jgi:hypothetical protein
MIHIVYSAGCVETSCRIGVGRLITRGAGNGALRPYGCPYRPMALFDRPPRDHGVLDKTSYHHGRHDDVGMPDPYESSSPPVEELSFIPMRRAASGEPPGLSHEPSRRRLGWRLVLPTLFVVIITAGTASALLVWIIKHNTRTFKDSYRSGTFDLDEGSKLVHGVQSGRLTGLTISSVAVSVSYLR